MKSVEGGTGYQGRLVVDPDVLHALERVRKDDSLRCYRSGNPVANSLASFSSRTLLPNRT